MIKSIKTMSASDSERRGKDASKDKQRNASKQNKNYHYHVDVVTLDAIAERVKGAVIFNKTDKPLLPSRKLILSKSFSQATVVCPISGIVSLLDIPHIPGFSLVYESPLADVSNARGIVQKGRLYLRQLDGQILAGLFLVLAQAYELYRDSYDGTGAERNALLRSIPTDMLIEALLLIENWIHSGNSVYIPKISLVYEKTDTRNVLTARMKGWLDAVLAALTKPDTVEYDANAKPVKVVFDSMAPQKKAKRKALQEKAFAQKIWHQDKKLAKGHIESLDASQKFKSFLSIVFTGQGIQTTEPALLTLAAQKLEDIGSVPAKALRDLLLKERTQFAPLDIFEEEQKIEDIKFVQIPIGYYVSAEQSEAQCKDARDCKQSVNSEQSVQQETEAVRQLSVIEAAALATQEPDYSAMTPIQKILAKKAWRKANGLSVQAEPVFSPEKQIVIPHVYVPSAAQKLQEAKIAKQLENEDDAPF